jgi:membrane-bound metal-dependent hydrolase YbcI (DUF457 family)
MFLEHIIYSTALAILIGMVFYKYTGRDSSWIIIPCSLLPDLDVVTNPVLRSLGIRLLLDGSSIHHGTFHNIAFMMLFGIAVAFLLNPLGIRFFDSLFFAMVGFGAHLLEDWLVYDPGYMFLWPFSSKILGFGLLPDIMNEENYVKDFFRIANTEVLLLGLALLLLAIIIRTYYERSSSWIRWYMPDSVYKRFFQENNPNPKT